MTRCTCCHACQRIVRNMAAGCEIVQPLPQISPSNARDTIVQPQIAIVAGTHVAGNISGRSDERVSTARNRSWSWPPPHAHARRKIAHPQSVAVPKTTERCQTRKSSFAYQWSWCYSMRQFCQPAPSFHPVPDSTSWARPAIFPVWWYPQRAQCNALARVRRRAPEQQSSDSTSQSRSTVCVGLCWKKDCEWLRKRNSATAARHHMRAQHPWHRVGCCLALWVQQHREYRVWQKN